VGFVFLRDFAIQTLARRRSDREGAKMAKDAKHEEHEGSRRGERLRAS
jgi:hypothetical protein